MESALEYIKTLENLLLYSANTAMKEKGNTSTSLRIFPFFWLKMALLEMI